MKKSVYLDTTVPSYLFDERKSLKYPCSITKKWWSEEREKFFIFISVETLVKIINAKLDLFTPELITPLELFTER
jgi:hypothetical protein